MNLLPWIFASLSAAAAQEHGGLAPRRNWRAVPEAIVASPQPEALAGLARGRTCQWIPGSAAAAALSLRFDDSWRGPVLLTYSATPQVETTLEFSFDSRDGKSGEWVELERAKSGRYLNKVDLRPAPRTWLRVRFRKADPEPMRIWNLGLYAPQSGALNDYWIGIGASLQQQGIRQARFNPWMRRLFPQADPIVFNLGVRGWGVFDLANNLPALLEQHPFAGYALVDIGGNDVSSNRPYPGAAAELERGLHRVLDRLEAAGVVPILGRISYRSYGGDKPVPPEENGSWPYAVNIYDPLCRTRTPLFYDPQKERCAVDLYSWFRDNPGELGADGVHLNVKGEASWSRIWAQAAGPRVYGSAPVSPASRIARAVVRRAGKPFPRLELSPPEGEGSPHPWRLRVWDVTGRLVARIPRKGAAPGKPGWDFRDNAGRAVPQGRYFYEVRQGRARVRGSVLLLD